MTRSAPRSSALLLVSMLVAGFAACSNDGSTPSTSSTTTAPATLEETTWVLARPAEIVSAAGNAEISARFADESVTAYRTQTARTKTG